MGREHRYAGVCTGPFTVPLPRRTPAGSPEATTRPCRYSTAFFSSAPALNLGTVFAAICIDSPV